MATSMRKINGLVRDVKEKVRLLQEECDSLTSTEILGYQRDPTLVQVERDQLRAEVSELRASCQMMADERNKLRAELSEAKKKPGNIEFLREARVLTREALGAEEGERTASAAKRVVRERDQLQYQLAEAKRKVRVSSGRDQTSLAALRESRKAVREILGAKRGESTRDAAQRVRNEQRARSSDQATAIDVYKDLDKLAIEAGFPPGSVGAYVYSLREKAGK